MIIDKFLILRKTLLFTLVGLLLGILTACGNDSDSSTPTDPDSGTPSLGNGTLSYLEFDHKLLISPSNMVKGSTVKLLAIGKDSNDALVDMSANVSWRSDNTNFLTVSSTGLVTAIAPGNARVFAEVTNQTSNISISHSFEVKQVTFAIIQINQPLIVGETVNLDVSAMTNTGFYSTGGEEQWSVSSTTLADIDSLGNLTTKSAGTILVSVKYYDLQADLSIVIERPSKPGAFLISQTAATIDQISLDWADIPNALSYTLNWTTPDASGAMLVANRIDLATSSYTHMGLMYGNPYFYWVEAHVTSGNVTSETLVTKTLSGNSATLTGTSIGLNTITNPNNSIHKTVALRVGTNSTDLDIGNAYIGRLNSQNNNISLIVPFTNPVPAPPGRLPTPNYAYSRCDITLNQIEFQDSSGTTLANSPLYVADRFDLSGQIRADTQGSFFANCLVSGTTGYILALSTFDPSITPNNNFNILSKVYAQTANRAFSKSNSAPAIAIIPTDYTVTNSNGSSAPTQTLKVTLKNIGQQAGKIKYVRYILFDDAQQPLIWSHLDKTPSSAGPLDMVLNPAQSTQVETLVLYDGTSNSIYVNVEFDVAP